MHCQSRHAPSSDISEQGPTVLPLLLSFLSYLLPLSPLPDFGVEKAASIQGLDAAGVDRQLQQLIKEGESLPR
jgi:hypothetical protein